MKSRYVASRFMIIMLLLPAFVSFGQNHKFKQPDYKKIEANITNKKSNFYYPTLMTRFEKADLTMTLEEKRHLYYGYSFQPAYSSHGKTNFSDSINAILLKDEIDENDLQRIIELGDLALAINPFDLQVMSYQLYVLGANPDSKQYKDKFTQVHILVDAILSSGNGKTKETAFFVIYTSHEHEILNILGLAFGGRQQQTKQYDYLTVSENDWEIKGLYFDITPCLSFSYDSFR